MLKFRAMKVKSKPQGRIQRTVLEALQQHPSLTTSQLARMAYGRDGINENPNILRAIKGLTRRGFSFKKVRLGLVNKEGYVYLWSLE
ncbi:hypothetical protein [Paenochrobactrum glaciei]|uniref:Helix-turn-helix domain-containing protein n=1 Tax=Paenochrobactrum glaciei TaxID=486407 RepID=A0ABN1FN98_9HYPH